MMILWAPAFGAVAGVTLAPSTQCRREAYPLEFG
jgi:hypothetical protein